jgi:glucosamine-6-phosphate deaminase
MRVLVTPDYQALSRDAAQFVIETILSKPDSRLGLPTGQTPLGMYAELARRHREENIDFSQLRTFNLDEYAGLPAQHPKSYHAYMRANFFSGVNVLPDNIDIPNGAAAVDAAAECARYERAIREAGGLDLLVAGVGANGHIAFNEPGSSFSSRTRLVSLSPETIANALPHFAGDSEVPRQAITVGIGTILEARRILVIAAGSRKADAVKRALQGPVSESLPASALQLHSDVTAILDKAAAPEFFG